MKSGIIAVIGRANAGKSTLVNVLVGEKVAIVSPKPQTTRENIMGVLNGEGFQAVFVDTPGLYKASGALSRYMQKSAENAAKDVDLIIYAVDGHKGLGAEDMKNIERHFQSDIPLIVAFTKTDIMEKERVPQELAKLSEIAERADIIPVSARKGRNNSELLKLIEEKLPEGEPLYPEDVVSDKSEKFMVSEIMREKILLLYEKEIPHGAAVLINEFYRREDGVYEVNLDIICEKPNHKGIIIGKGGRALKEALSFARKDMEKFLDSKVFLTAYVKVKEDWRSRESLVKEFGYDDKF